MLNSEKNFTFDFFTFFPNHKFGFKKCFLFKAYLFIQIAVIEVIIMLVENTVNATHIMPSFTTAKREIRKIIVNPKLICNEILGLLMEFNNKEAAQPYILGITERQIRIKTGMAGIHLLPKTIGTYIGAKEACNKISGTRTRVTFFRLLKYRFLNCA